jgi:hypothetical protein
MGNFNGSTFERCNVFDKNTDPNAQESDYCRVTREENEGYLGM